MVVLLLLVGLLTSTACSLKRNITDDSMIVKKNTITVDASDVLSRKLITSSELSDYVSLPKNKSLFNFNVWEYNRKQTKFKKWLQKISDNPPSYYNFSKAEQSEKRMMAYLNNRGYFNSKVIHQVTRKDNPKKAYITYNVKLAKPYSIQSINYNIPDSAIAQIITKQLVESTIKVGQQYDFYKLDDLRNSITDILRNKGYLFLNADYVFYEIDSMFQNHTLAITLNIRPNYLLQQEGKSIEDDLYNRVFYLNNIYIKPNSERNQRRQSESIEKVDSIIFVRPRYKHIHDSVNYTLLETNQPYMRYKALMPSVFLETGDLYQEKNIKKNQTLLSGLPVIGYCDIVLDTVSRSLWPDTAYMGLVDARIDLAKGTRQNYSIGLEATNNMGAFGTSVNLSYNNKNIFRGSELLTLQLKLATEIQSNLGNNNMDYSFWLFNTLEGGIQASITFPKFLAPFNQYRFQKFFRPKTIISAGYNFQKRPDYNRDIVLASFGYNWKPEINQSHQLTLLDINTVKIFKTDEFEQKLKSYNNQRLYEQYSDHLIMALNYSFTYSTQEYGKAKDFIYLQAIGESSGNLLYAINSIAQSPTKQVDQSNYYTLFGIRYAQYLKGSLEFRRYNYIGKYNHFAYRAYFGIGVPYGNAVSLPFEKSFYGGGANDLRGWAINVVGPGGYVDNNHYERSGDIKLEANAEFRFGMLSFIKGAIFTDIGNVWLLHQENSFPNGQFKFSDFYRQLYWDAGFGLRLDFSFFIIRVDAAVPLYSPGSIYDTKWVVSKMNLSDVVLSFGIGYPF
ncbi:MAG: BamA/TamA family outer membrane protein [Bacteroidales bacterium]|nr:BamA/TamA family outer membrane protein [Bacteroidales bacterium]